MKKKILSITLILVLLIGIVCVFLICFKKDDNKENENIAQEEYATAVSGNFVKYKNNTYYWKLAANSRKQIGLHAQFYDVLNVKNDLIKIDENGKEEIVITEKGSGDIFIVNDKIFLSYVTNEYQTEKQIYSIDLNGENKKEYAKGEMKYIVGDYIYCQTKLNGDIFAINTKNGEVKQLKENANIVGCENETVYYTEIYNSNVGELKIGIISAEKDNGIIAAFSSDEFEDYKTTFGFPIEVLQVEKKNNNINIHIVYRAGTANIIQEICTVIIDENDNENIKIEKNTNLDVDTVESQQDTGNVYTVIEQVNGEYINNIMYIDTDTETSKEIINEKQLYKEFDLKEDDEHLLTLYAGDVVDGSVYIILDYAEHYPEEDIGWRYSYKRIKTICFKYDIKTEEISIIYEFGI